MSFVISKGYLNLSLGYYQPDGPGQVRTFSVQIRIRTLVFKYTYVHLVFRYTYVHLVFKYTHELSLIYHKHDVPCRACTIALQRPMKVVWCLRMYKDDVPGCSALRACNSSSNFVFAGS